MRLTRLGRRMLGLAALAACTGVDRAPGAPPAKPPKPPETAWQALPPTPDLPEPAEAGMTPVEGGTVFFARFGSGPPVLFLHGGMANSSYWGHQVRALMATHSVLVMDTRGHGRSPFIPGGLGYRVFAADVAALLASLGIGRVALVGWSDGGITGLELAIGKPGLVSGLFAFGANSDPGGLTPGGSQSPVFQRFAERAAREYRTLSPHPADWPRLVAGLREMWRREPRIGAGPLGAVRVPVTIADGEHDEVIRPQHTRYLAQAVPGAKLVLLPGTSHFAMLQDPGRFNEALANFLSGTA